MLIGSRKVSRSTKQLQTLDKTIDITSSLPSDKTSSTFILCCKLQYFLRVFSNFNFIHPMNFWWTLLKPKWNQRDADQTMVGFVVWDCEQVWAGASRAKGTEKLGCRIIKLYFLATLILLSVLPYASLSFPHTFTTSNIFGFLYSRLHWSILFPFFQIAKVFLDSIPTT